MPARPRLRSADRCADLTGAVGSRRLASTAVAALAASLALTGVTARAFPPPQRTSGSTNLPSQTVPVQPVPVQVVPPPGLNPLFGPQGYPPSGAELGVSGMAPINEGGGGGISDPPAAQAGVDSASGEIPNAETRVSLRADEEDVRQVLALLGRQAEVNILVSPGVTGNVRIDLENVSFRQALDAVLKTASLAARQEQGLVYVYTLEEFDTLKGRERRPMIRVYHLNYVTAADVQSMIQPFVSSTGTITVTPAAAVGIGGGGGGAMGGGGGNSASAGGGSTGGGQGEGNRLAYHDMVIVRDYPDNLAVIDEIIKRIDVQPPQVLIEAVILSVRLRDEQELGVNFSIVDNLAKVAAVSGNGALLNAAGGFSPGTVLNPATGQLVPGYLAPAQGLKFGFISNNVTGFIRAIEAFNKVNILASPRILVLNKQQAEIQLGQRLGFRNTVTNLTSSLQTVEFLSVGTLLSLRPYVSNDGMIRLEIHPEKSTGVLDAQGIPQTNTSELTTNILVPDGVTVVIGGLIDDSDEMGEDGTPGLMRLPLVGAAFRNRRTVTVKNELIVLLTPRVIRRGGLPDPMAGVPPRGVLGLPNSGAMPGPSYVGTAGSLPGGPVIGPAGPATELSLDAPGGESLPLLPGSGGVVTDESGSTLERFPTVPSGDSIPPSPPNAGSPTSPPPPPEPGLPFQGSNAPAAGAAESGLESMSSTTGSRVGTAIPVSVATSPRARVTRLVQPRSGFVSVTDPPLVANLQATRSPADPRLASADVTSHPVAADIPEVDTQAQIASATVPPPQFSTAEARQGATSHNGSNLAWSEAVSAATPTHGAAVASDLPGWRHVVRAGESFDSIAQQYYGTPAFARALWAANRDLVARPDSLRPGTTLIIPPASLLDLAAGELPPLMTDRERAATPLPRLAPPAVDRPKESGPLLRWFHSRPRKDKAAGSSRNEAHPTLYKIPPGTPTASNDAGYRPGDLTRALLRRIGGGNRPDGDAVVPTAMPAELLASDRRSADPIRSERQDEKSFHRSRGYRLGDEVAPDSQSLAASSGRPPMGLLERFVSAGARPVRWPSMFRDSPENRVAIGTHATTAKTSSSSAPADAGLVRAAWQVDPRTVAARGQSPDEALSFGWLSHECRPSPFPAGVLPQVLPPVAPGQPQPIGFAAPQN